MANYKEICNAYHFNRNKLLKRKPLEFSLEKQIECVNRLREVLVVGDFFICEVGGLYDADHQDFKTFWITVIRVEEGILAFHSDMMIFWPDSDVIPDSIPFIPDNDGWKEAFRKIGYNNFELNQYDYCNLMLESFWKRIFNKTPDDMWCAGIVSAHGDKAYGYKSEWEKHEIPFNRGVLLYLLTYTKLLGDTPKHESCNWVIANYPKYLPMIEETEKEIGFS